MMHPSVWPRLLLLCLVALSLSACGRFGKEDPVETLPVEQLYAEAKRSLEGGNQSRAQRYYRRLIARFPFGPYTEQAQLELSYSLYKSGQAEEATSAVNRFIRTYPTHEHIAYAYYLRGLINFDREQGFLSRVGGLDMTLRDQGAPRQAFNDFAELIQRYPTSRYAVDARQRMVYLRNQLARYEINVASYYLRRGAYVGAISRAQYLLENYPQSAYVGDALAVMVESYRKLGQDTLSSDARRVLQLNHPDHAYFSGGWPRQQARWKRLIPLMGENRS
ncbi:MAG: outer membrane protein assembly factor BamD [Aquimonas sp.]|nr:outer membrane protein assembly factor BamD [Aquimonas sp.]